MPAGRRWSAASARERRHELAAKLEKLRAVGVEYVLLSGAGSRDNLRRFARDLMPAFSTE